MIALALARMVNLKSFTWDMPRRLKADVWSALSSSAHSRLQSVWVQFHENFRNYWNDLSNTNAPQNYNVEYPTLSILPPVKGLTVLAIDQASYLEELAVLIERSRDRLRALRIGLGWHVEQRTWSNPSADSSHATSKWPKLGGVLEVLTGSFQDNVLQKLNKTSKSLSPSAAEDAFLKLEVLELERITLSVPILMCIIDWTKITTLSLVKCERSEKLWRNLHRRYAPSNVGGASINFPLRLKSADIRHG